MGLNIMMFVKEMDDSFALEILAWKYDKPYDSYSNEYSSEAMHELLNHLYFVVVDNQDAIIGYFCIEESAQLPIGEDMGIYPPGYIDVGIGMRPDLTGKGKGELFLSFILEQLHAGAIPIRLTVAVFNTRAIHLYERLGFVKDQEFPKDDVVFMTMVKRP